MSAADANTISIVRFAPSPNGRLHVGHARSALLNWRAAQESGGTFLLRMEDIDTARCRAEFETAICDDLAWLGLSWPLPVRRQSDHFDDYRAGLDELKALGLVYPAFLSRAEAASLVGQAEAAGRPWPRDPDGTPLYPGPERYLTDKERKGRLADGEPFAWRLDMQAAVSGVSTPLQWREKGRGPSGESGDVPANPAAWGDVVLARKETPTSYHLSVVVDDELQQVTDIIRGEDLFHATSVHRLLQHLLGFRAPEYTHHSLVRDDAGRKLSKSSGDTAIASLRERGLSPADIASLAGLPHGPDLRSFAPSS